MFSDASPTLHLLDTETDQTRVLATSTSLHLLTLSLLVRKVSPIFRSLIELFTYDEGPR